MAQALEVLRYMKERGMEPSEVMYTSLMSRAGDLAKLERRAGSYNSKRGHKSDGGRSQKRCGRAISDDDDDDGASAIEVYTELMGMLMNDANGRATGMPQGKGVNTRANRGSHRHRDTMARTDGSPTTSSSSAAHRNQQLSAPSSPSPASDEANILLLRVFLVFQEMTASGVRPDLTCYNALLRACARAGDVARARDVLCRMGEDRLEPDDMSWREALRGAARAGDAEAAVEFWSWALEGSSSGSDGARRNATNGGEGGGGTTWRPNAEAFEALVDAHVRAAAASESRDERRRLLERVLDMYEDVMGGVDVEGMGLTFVDPSEVRRSSRASVAVVRAAVSVELLSARDAAVVTATRSPIIMDGEHGKEMSKTAATTLRSQSSRGRRIAVDLVSGEGARRALRTAQGAGGLTPSLSHGGAEAGNLKALELARNWAAEATSSSSRT